MPSTLPDRISGRVEAHCAKSGARLTKPRRDVMAVVAASTRPLSAYDIIAAMPKGTNPPTVYRALDFWLGEGFIHRIGSLGLYMLCGAGHRHSGAQFLICDSCGRIDEKHDCAAPLPFSPDQKGFTVHSWFVEMHGRCADCSAAPVKPAGCSTGCSHG